jgi:hypothetical protein
MSQSKTSPGLNLKTMRYVAPHPEEAADAGEGSVNTPCTQDLPGCIFSGRGKVTTFGPSKGHLGDQPYHHTTPWEQSGRALRGTGGLYHRGAEVRDSEGHRCEEVAERRSVGFGDEYVTQMGHSRRFMGPTPPHVAVGRGLPVGSTFSSCFANIWPLEECRCPPNGAASKSGHVYDNQRCSQAIVPPRQSPYPTPTCDSHCDRDASHT